MQAHIVPTQEGRLVYMDKLGIMPCIPQVVGTINKIILFYFILFYFYTITKFTFNFSFLYSWRCICIQLSNMCSVITPVIIELMFDSCDFSNMCSVIYDGWFSVTNNRTHVQRNQKFSRTCVLLFMTDDFPSQIIELTFEKIFNLPKCTPIIYDGCFSGIDNRGTTSASSSGIEHMFGYHASDNRTCVRFHANF